MPLASSATIGAKIGHGVVLGLLRRLDRFVGLRVNGICLELPGFGIDDVDPSILRTHYDLPIQADRGGIHHAIGFDLVNIPQVVGVKNIDVPVQTSNPYLPVVRPEPGSRTSSRPLRRLPQLLSPSKQLRQQQPRVHPLSLPGPSRTCDRTRRCTPSRSPPAELT